MSNYEVVRNGASTRSVAVLATPQRKTDPQTVKDAVLAVMRDRKPRHIGALCEATGYSYQQVWHALQSSSCIVRDGEETVVHGKPGRAKLVLYRMVG